MVLFLVLGGALIAFIVAIKQGKLHVKEIELPLLGSKIKLEAKDEEKPSHSKTPRSRPAKTSQDARATHGGEAEVKQRAPRGSNANQKAIADGEGSRLKADQSIQ
jgi:hypothetical protein